jgi:tetratricopeptide (TPR) repeat protein
MRRFGWMLLVIALAPWAFLAFGETPKKGKRSAKKPANPVDLASLSEAERRAFMLEKFANDRRKKQDEKQKEERAAALKAAANFEAQLKAARAEEKPALLYELGITHLRASNTAPALRYLQQAAESPGEWTELAKIHLFDIYLYDNHSLDDAGSVVHVADAASVGTSPIPAASLLSPRQTPDKPLSAGAVAANLDARRALLDFLEGRPPGCVPTGAGSRFWGVLGNWSPEFPEVLDEQSDAAWLVRLAELHIVAGDHATSISLAGAIITGKGLHPTNSQKSLAYFRRAQAVYQLHAAMQPSERGLKDAVADYALAVKAAKDAPWAGEALFLQGNVLWNQFQDDAGAAKLWTELLAKYPDCTLAENAAYNIGVLHQLYGESDKAKAAFANFRKRFPNSKFLAGLNSEGLAGHIKPIPRP